MYYNTTNLNGKELFEAYRNANNQNDIILNFIKYQTSLNVSYKTSSSVLSKISRLKRTPITSIRRAVNTLVNLGLLEYTGDYQIGNYGKPEKIFKLK